MTKFKVLLFILSFVLNIQSKAQNILPEQVVQIQLEAYNEGDIDKFMSVFHQEAELWNLGDEKPIAEGWANLKAIYTNLFEKSPNLHSEVINRTKIGNKIIDYEKITGRNNSNEALFLIMIYEIKDDKIYRAFSVREK